MKPDIQPILENEKVFLFPLAERDFDDLYRAASDPAVWEQHPNPDRWRLEVFRTYFEGAMQSKGAFKIVEKTSGEIIGSTRFYDYNEQESSILIGYTFLAAKFWGRGFNHAVKISLLDYIFRFVKKVYFHIGANNVRSQIAITRIGADKCGELEVNYYGEASRLNFVYEISRETWEKLKHRRESDA